MLHTVLTWRAVIFYFALLGSTASESIIIVGAGISGYTAAARLMENGHNDIVILEAENRTGGRIFSIPFAQGWIDLGGQWCHGDINNPTYDFLNGNYSFGDTQLTDFNNIFIESNGNAVDQNKLLRLSEYGDMVTKKIEDCTEMAKFNNSFGAFFVQKYQDILHDKNFSDIDTSLVNEELFFEECDANSFYGSTDWFVVSSKYDSILPFTDGNMWLTWKDEGYKTLFDFVTKKRPDPSQALDIDSKILLNKEVTNIAWNPNAQLNESDKAVVKCADNSSYIADHVIFTASLGVLKERHQSLFTPRLPKRKIEAIETVGFGIFAKIFLEFEEPFWPMNISEWAAYSILWREDDINALIGSDREWLLALYQFIRVDYHPNVICGLVAGRGIELYEALSDEKIFEDTMWILQRILNKKINYPLNFRRTQWLNNRNFLGAYSYYTLAAEAKGIMPIDLSSSLFNAQGKPIILFAGEHTDDMYPGFVYSGLSSGFKTGQKLVDLYRK